MKFLKLIFFLGCFAAASVVLAQSKPTIEIILSQSTAHKGDHVNANVTIRDAVNIGGADIGITVDDKCLRIVKRNDGTFLPTTAESGGFSPFSELHDHDTRFATSITDRSKLGNGTAVFFSVELEVTCDQGIAPVDITFAELSAYKDPAAKEVELIAYRLSDKTVNVFNTTLEIDGQGQAAGTTPNTSQGQSATVAPTTSQGETAAASQSSVMPIVLIVLTLAGVILLVVVFWFMRRRSKDENQE